jgi:thiol-disulfide isomerase/thioredoxin
VTEIFLRLILAAAIVAAGIAVYQLYNRRLARRGAARLAELGWRRGAKVLVYFTTPSCMPCKTVQRPAIDAAKARLGAALDVIEINAEAQPELASRWGVLTVPTTYLFNSHGDVERVNHGIVRREQLFAQIEAI